MPIYEFKCVDCNYFNEFLLINSKDNIDLKCSKCNSKNLERILSMGSFITCKKSTKNSSNVKEIRNCSSGSCTTYNIQGVK